MQPVGRVRRAILDLERIECVDQCSGQRLFEGLVEFWTASGKWPDCADDVPYNFRAECERMRNTAKEEFWG